MALAITASSGRRRRLDIVVPLMAERTSRIGVLTGGGDAPGLNAVIRAVVKAGWNSGMEVIGLEDSFDGLLDPSRTRALTPRDVTGILRLGGTILGTTNRGNPFDYPADGPGGHMDYSDRVIETFARMQTRRAGGDRRRRHAGHRPPVLPEGDPGRRRAQDDRQRHRRHVELLRLRHRGGVRGRRHRPAAHHRAVAPAGDGGGSDGPLRRVDRAPCRHGRRRRRDPDPGDSLRPREGGRTDPRTRSPGARASASWWWPRAPRRSAGPAPC